MYVCICPIFYCGKHEYMIVSITSKADRNYYNPHDLDSRTSPLKEECLTIIFVTYVGPIHIPS